MLGQIAAHHVQMFQKISFPRHHMRQDPDLDDSCENRQHLTASTHYQIDNSSVIHPFSVNDPATPYPDMCFILRNVGFGVDARLIFLIPCARNSINDIR